MLQAQFCTHPSFPLQLHFLEVHLHKLRCNGVTQGQKSLYLWLHSSFLGSRTTPHFQMSGKNPAAPPFIPLDDLEDELSITPTYFSRFTSGGSGSGTPIPRSATPKRARTTTSPPPPPAPSTDWALEYRNYRKEAEGLSEAHAGNFNPKALGVILNKLEMRHTESISCNRDLRLQLENSDSAS